MSFFLILFIIITSAVASLKTSSFELLTADQPNRFNDIKLSKVVGPESIAFDCKGRGPYVGVSDGRVLRWRGRPNLGWSEFAIIDPHRNKTLCDDTNDPETEQICGRPLGLKFNTDTCDLYIADAYYGLLKVGRSGGVAETLAASSNGVAFGLTNGLDIDSTTGQVYFTDSSTQYKRRDLIQAVTNRDHTGRLMKYSIRTKKVTVLLRNLSLPNGVALSKDGSFIVVAEMGKKRILRIWIKGTRAHNVEVFARLKRYPDNIKTNPNGDFWVALNSGRNRKVVASGVDSIPWNTKDPVAVKFDQDGNVKAIIDGKYRKTLEAVSEVEEMNGTLWIGSYIKPFLGKLKVIRP